MGAQFADRQLHALEVVVRQPHVIQHQVADFIQGLESGKPQGPTFKDALETQCVLDAILDSAKSQKWVTVARV